MSSIMSFLSAHWATIIAPVLVAVIDFSMSKISNQQVNGILHALEVVIKGNSNPPSPPAAS